MRNVLHDKPAEGEIIEINLDPTGVEFQPVRAKVAALLSVQFTALWLDGTDTMSFLFYAEAGSTWRKVKNG